MSTEKYITIAFLFAMMAISLIGNLLVISSAALSKKLRRVTHILIFNLALSDLCITCFSLPLRLSRLLGYEWGEGFTPCSFTVACTMFFFSCSNYNLFLVTLDRFLGVCFPLKYRARASTNKVCYFILTSWVLAGTVSFAPLFGLGQLKENVRELTFVCTFGDILRTEYIVSVEFATLFLPWIVMIILYMFILKTGFNSVSFSSKNASVDISHSLRLRERMERQKAQEIKLARAIFIILSLYTVFMVPIGVIDTLETLGVYVPVTAIKVTVSLAYINPAVNPPVYAANSQEYRRIFLRMLCCKVCNKLGNEKLDNRAEAVTSSSAPRKHPKVMVATLPAIAENIDYPETVLELNPIR